MSKPEETQCHILAQRLKDRDPEALAELYDLYGRLALTISLRIVRDRATAEDLTQETFLKVWNGARYFDEHRSTLAQWVATIARNRAYDYVRSVECRMNRETSDLDQVRTKASSSAWQQILSGDMLRRAMACLTPDQRLTLQLWYREGMTHAEIAERIQTPLGTVKTRLRTTLRMLREQLQCSMPAPLHEK